MLGEVYALNTVIDEDRDLVHVNFGEVIASHLAAVAFVADSDARAGRPALHDDRSRRRPAIRSTRPTTRR